MKGFTIILALLIAAGCDFRSSESYHKDANQLEQRGKYKEAIVLLDKAVKKDPENIKALLDRGVDKSISEDYQGAISDYTKVIEIDSLNSLAFLNRGKNKKRLKDYEGAITDFNRAISTKGGELIYLNKVHNSFFETDYEFDVNMEEIRFERGIAYYYIDSFKRAFSDFDFSIEKNFSLPASYYWRGMIFLRYNMKEKGCMDLLKAKELGNPDVADVIESNCR